MKDLDPSRSEGSCSMKELDPGRGQGSYSDEASRCHCSAGSRRSQCSSPSQAGGHRQRRQAQTLGAWPGKHYDSLQTSFFLIFGALLVGYHASPRRERSASTHLEHQDKIRRRRQATIYKGVRLEEVFVAASRCAMYDAPPLSTQELDLVGQGGTRQSK